jgi:hypothetical protein
MNSRQVKFNQHQANEESNFDANSTYTQKVPYNDHILRGDMLTISKWKNPEYYVDLVRHHFLNNSDKIELQALGLSCTQLISVACLLNLRGYATYKKIKNDHLTVPVIKERTGDQIGLIKRVRLTVKLRKAEGFNQKVLMEDEMKYQYYGQKKNGYKNQGENLFKEFKET